MAPKMLQKSSSGAGGLRESLRERLERAFQQGGTERSRLRHERSVAKHVMGDWLLLSSEALCLYVKCMPF